MHPTSCYGGTLKPRDKFIFDDYQQGTYINIQFADDNDDGNVYSYKMINEDDEFIYFEYIG